MPKVRRELAGLGNLAAFMLPTTSIVHWKEIPVLPIVSFFMSIIGRGVLET